MLPSLRKLFWRPARATLEPPLSVRFDDWGVYKAKHRQDQARMEWKEIKLVAICIEDSACPQPYWYIGNDESLLRIPNNAPGAEELFFDGFAEKIPGFKCDTTFRTIIEASAAMEGTFILWRAEEADE